ncbi:LacI family DNA-binding transcriptional regulator [Roseinatronobacter alkalisoli]|uniref:LacI family DNA-binding transcriptional regulator n=1 Tax=Roseinatronobacter alkalisoli TaxID=3028235 RepID=A0ABT5T4C4_9RHOB|nr:LacI family DNA-binding transcriptional regulator [Roseinatronobacter sp. HJB301]MDD7969967.1 LacI family DNA-binding transcriptional regulator [Roseinatronobacter sp. HJB301]
MKQDKLDKSRGKSFVSAQQVAERAGVSRSAVSRTFTDGASVAPATRKRVLQAAEELGYTVNHLARGLIREKSNIVSLVVADINTPYQAKMTEALTRRLQAANKVAMIINSSGESTDVEMALRQTLHYRADATIVLSGQPKASLIETCLNNGQHVILINRDDPVPGPVSVIVTNRAAARQAFDMLERAGCRKLAVIASTVGSASLAAREKAFVAAAQSANIDVSVSRLGPTAYASGAEAARQVLSGADRPDGVFCVTDLLACGFLDAARNEFGIKIPDELCVVGFDDIEQAGWSSYELTTFRQPIEQIAEHVVDLIDHHTPVDAIQDPIRFQAEPVWRKSVRPR